MRFWKKLCKYYIITIMCDRKTLSPLFWFICKKAVVSRNSRMDLFNRLFPTFPCQLLSPLMMMTRSLGDTPVRRMLSLTRCPWTQATTSVVAPSSIPSGWCPRLTATSRKWPILTSLFSQINPRPSPAKAQSGYTAQLCLRGEHSELGASSFPRALNDALRGFYMER